MVIFYAIQPSAHDGRLMMVSQSLSSQLCFLGKIATAEWRVISGRTPTTSQNSLESTLRPNWSIGRGRARTPSSRISCITQSRRSSATWSCGDGVHEEMSSHQSYTRKSVRHHRCPASLSKFRCAARIDRATSSPWTR